jgi:hypothetical protein
MLYGFGRLTAPILVMLPPAGMSFLLVSRLALALSADFQVIRWESRGCPDTVVPLTDGGSELSGPNWQNFTTVHWPRFHGVLFPMNSFECWKIWESLSNARDMTTRGQIFDDPLGSSGLLQLLPPATYCGDWRSHDADYLSKSIGSDCINMNAFSINPNLVVLIAIRRVS